MNYAIFDDHKWENFYPITLNRSVGDLRVGILKFRQRIAGYFEIDKYSWIIHKPLTDLYRERHPAKDINKLDSGDTLFVNSRLIIDDVRVKKINSIPPDTCLVLGETLIAARMKVDKRIDDICSNEVLKLLSGLRKIEDKDVSFWEYVWELTGKNGEYINKDFEDFFFDSDNHYDIEPGVTILNPYNVWIGENVSLQPGVVIDASEGAVVLDEGCRIMPNSVIIGPAYIGKKSIVKVGAKIYEGTSIGPVCKVGGEIEGTIFQGYSNKQHDGFLGHSYLGEWINLGANTNNSDLKNNYKNVDAYFEPERVKIDTECMFVGSIIGDHTKTAISTVLNTGVVIGMGCNLFGNEIVTDHIASFSWGHGVNHREYEISRFFETAEKVKQRRNLPLTENERRLFSDIQRGHIFNRE